MSEFETAAERLANLISPEERQQLQPLVAEIRTSYEYLTKTNAKGAVAIGNMFRRAKEILRGNDESFIPWIEYEFDRVASLSNVEIYMRVASFVESSVYKDSGIVDSTNLGVSVLNECARAFAHDHRYDLVRQVLEESKDAHMTVRRSREILWPEKRQAPKPQQKQKPVPDPEPESDEPDPLEPYGRGTHAHRFKDMCDDIVARLCGEPTSFERAGDHTNLWLLLMKVAVEKGLQLRVYQPGYGDYDLLNPPSRIKTHPDEPGFWDGIRRKQTDETTARQREAIARGEDPNEELPKWLAKPAKPEPNEGKPFTLPDRRV